MRQKWWRNGLRLWFVCFVCCAVVASADPGADPGAGAGAIPVQVRTGAYRRPEASIHSSVQKKMKPLTSTTLSQANPTDDLNWSQYSMEITKEDREMQMLRQRQNDKFMKNTPKVRNLHCSKRPLL